MPLPTTTQKKVQMHKAMSVPNRGANFADVSRARKSLDAGLTKPLLSDEADAPVADFRLLAKLRSSIASLIPSLRPNTAGVVIVQEEREFYIDSDDTTDSDDDPPPRQKRKSCMKGSKPPSAASSVGFVQFADSSGDSGNGEAPKRRQKRGSSSKSPSGTSSQAISAASSSVDIVHVTKEWKGGAGFDSSSESAQDSEDPDAEAQPKRKAAVKFADKSERVSKHSSICGAGGDSGNLDQEKGSSVQEEESLRGLGQITFWLRTAPVIVAVSGILELVLQLLCLCIYIRHGMTAWIPAAVVLLLGAFMSLYITFHDIDVLSYLHDATTTNAKRRGFLIVGLGLVFGLCRGIQIKRAWARQMRPAEITEEWGEGDGIQKASTNLKSWQIGGPERAMPIALSTNIPFIIINAVSFLTVRWVFDARERYVLVIAGVVAMARTIFSIIEIDLSVSSHVVQRYEENAGRFQFLYPAAHVIFRVSEVSLRLMYYTALWWTCHCILDEQSATPLIIFAFGVEICVLLLVLIINSSPEESPVTHLIMSILLLLADVAHFVDQPSFSLPARKISRSLFVWRLATALMLIIVSCFVEGPLPVGLMSDCSVTVQRGWFFAQSLAVLTAVYVLMRLSSPIRCIGGDLHTAALMGNEELMQELLRPDHSDQVLDVDSFSKDGKMMTPAMLAAMGGYKSLLRMLIQESGADLNLQNARGETCLHLAVRSDSRQSAKVIKYLVRKGARADIRSHDGKTAGDLCKDNRHAHLPINFIKQLSEPVSDSGGSVTSRRPTLKRMADEMCMQKMQTGYSHDDDDDEDDEEAPFRLRDLFSNAEMLDLPPPRDLHSVSSLVSSRAAGLLSHLFSSQDVVPLGSLRRIGELGRGGFGTVIEVELPNQLVGASLVNKSARSRRFALKLQSKKGSQRSAFSEVKALLSVNHRFIVRLESSFQTPNFFAMLLELCPTDLNRILSSTEGPGGRYIGLSESRTARYMGQVLLALIHLHEMKGGGIVYRDLKPENILISIEDDAKLTDFGLAKLVGGVVDRGTMCGTMGFFPPELLDSDLVDDDDEGGEEEKKGEEASSSASDDSSPSCSDEDDDDAEDADKAGMFETLADRAARQRSRTGSSTISKSSYDVFKLDSYSFGVTLQVTLLGEDGALRKEIRKKGHLMLPMRNNEEETSELLQTLHRNGRLSAEALDLLQTHLLPFKPKYRSRLQWPEVANHKFFQSALGCEDLKTHLFTNQGLFAQTMTKTKTLTRRISRRWAE